MNAAQIARERITYLGRLMLRILVSVVLLTAIVLLGSNRSTRVVLGLVSLEPELALSHPDLASDYAPGIVLIGTRPDVEIVSRSRGLTALRMGREIGQLSATLKELKVAQAEPLSGISGEPINGGRSSGQHLGLTSSLDNVYRLSFSSAHTVEEVIKILEQSPDIAYAEPDYLARPALVPDDPLYGEQWWATAAQLEQAWEQTTGALTVTIATIDSGLDAAHPDFQNRLWVNGGEIADNGEDDDNNGFVDDIHGWNFLNGTASLIDENGHGTEVAGVLSATGNNGQGIAGTCWSCRMMVVKVMQPTGIVNYSHMAQGILYAAQKGAHVINISAGGYADSQTLRAAIEEAAQTAVVVAGAGNDDRADAFYPAAYPQVLAVAAVDESLAKSTFSNHGLWVDLAAPGVDIRTTTAGGTWGEASGTSVAAPLVSGIAGLVKTLNPTWSPTQIRAHLRQTAAPADDGLGAGIVDAAKAAENAQPALTIESYALNGEIEAAPVPNSAGNLLVVRLGNDWYDAHNVTATLSSSDDRVTIETATATFGTIATGESVASTPFEFDLGNVGHEADVPLTLTVSANGGTYTTDLALTLTTQKRISEISLPIADDAVWSADTLYVIQGKVPINAGVTLTISPGTTVRFAQDASLQVNGTLIADGTENAPIRFVADRSDGTWQGIAFGDSAVDATVNVNDTGDGLYLAGSIVRHARLASSIEAITCSGASPFLAHITSARSGVRCTPGDAPLWVQDSVMSGGIYVTQGVLYARRNRLSGQGLVATGEAYLADNEVIGASLSIGAGRMQDNIVVDGSLGLGSRSTATGNDVKGGGISAGNLVTVTGNIVEGGGISVGQNAIVMTNTVRHAPAAGLAAGPNVEARANRLIANALGIAATTGQVRQNLIAHSKGPALQVQGNTLQETHIVSNSFTSNYGITAIVGGVSSLNLKIEGNNFEGNHGPYDLKVELPWSQLSYVTANRNWWGVADLDAIEERVYHFNDDPSLARVTFVNYLTSPDESAPAYVRNVTIAPADVLGIEEGRFTVQFSRPMNRDIHPPLTFASAQRGTWDHFTTENSDLPGDTVRAAAVDLHGMVWFGTSAGAAARINEQWRAFTTANSGLPADEVTAVAADWDGSIWFGTIAGAARYNADAWTVYTSTTIVKGVSVHATDATTSTGLPSNNVLSLAVDYDRGKWFGTDAGVAWYDGANWMRYDVATSGLPHDRVQAIAPSWDGAVWFATPGGAARFDGLAWEAHTTANSLLPSDNVQTLVVARDGTAWFGTDAGLARYKDETWTVYTATIPAGPLPASNVTALTLDPNGTLWVGTAGGLASFDGVGWQQYSLRDDLPTSAIGALAADPWSQKWLGLQDGGVVLFHDSPDYAIGQDCAWLDDYTYRAAYDFDYMILRGPYSLTVGGAVGTDGLPSASNYDYAFDVDYAFAVVDFTPPENPNVSASAGQDSDAIAVSMSATDPDSAVVAYRYAIGTDAKLRDVVAWTQVPDQRQRTLDAERTASISLNRTGLKLIPGQAYYVHMQAQNPTGLWSQVGISAPTIAGLSKDDHRIYLPCVQK